MAMEISLSEHNIQWKSVQVLYLQEENAGLANQLL